MPGRSIEDRRKVAAIAAALTAYMAERKATLTPAAKLRQAPRAAGHWHASGREELMRMRMLWQRRMVPK